MERDGQGLRYVWVDNNSFLGLAFFSAWCQNLEILEIIPCPFSLYIVYIHIVVLKFVQIFGKGSPFLSLFCCLIDDMSIIYYDTIDDWR